ncbi:MAG: hypothetical protein QM703_13900 [Gemmatales bacterium]
MKDILHLRDIYRFPGYHARARVKSKPGDASAIVIALIRRRKKDLQRLREHLLSPLRHPFPPRPRPLLW